MCEECSNFIVLHSQRLGVECVQPLGLKGCVFTLEVIPLVAHPSSERRDLGRVAYLGLVVHVGCVRLWLRISTCAVSVIGIYWAVMKVSGVVFLISQGI